MNIRFIISVAADVSVFVKYFGNIEVGGKNVFAGRPDDRFGVGYYYTNISNPQLMTPFGDFRFLRDEHGMEAFYNFALTPWAHLTPNIQVIRGAQRQIYRSKRHPDLYYHGVEAWDQFLTELNPMLRRVLPKVTAKHLCVGAITQLGEIYNVA